MTDSPKMPIIPQTKVAELLDAYPELEQVLVEMAPPFKKLRNPVLRRTIARVTTLARAAAVADLPLRELILALRKAAGQPLDGDDLGPETADLQASDDGTADWVDASRVVWTVDADELLGAGEQPIAVVQRKAMGLGGEDLGLIRSTFRPAPLIDALEKQGFRTAVVRSDTQYATFVGRG